MNLHKSLLIKVAIIYIIAAAIITLIFPTKVKFKYDYAVGRPWHYELLTAPFPFSVQKSPAQLQMEKDSVTRSMIPYYTVIEDMYVKQKNQITQNYNQNILNVKSEYVKYILEALDHVYKVGVVSPDDYQSLLAGESNECFVIDENKVARKVEVSQLYSTTTAYEYILKNSPQNIQQNELRTADINNYIQPNLYPDKAMIDRVLQAKLAELTSVIGEVQRGERIVNTGDVVTDNTYQILESLKSEYESKLQSSSERAITKFGQFMIILMILSSLYTYLIGMRPQIMREFKNTFFFLIQILFFTALTYLGVSTGILNIYVIPYLALPILVRVFMDSRTAFIAHMVNTMLCALVAPFPLEFLLIQFLGGVVVILTLRNLAQRSDLIRSTFFVLLTMVVTYYAYTLLIEGSFSGISFNTLLNLAINFIFLMFTYLLVYLVERIFGYVSNISLVELSDINTPLLKQLSEVAPGTFQHSLQVSILASEAASQIGCDVRLIRAGALYHDIGKIKNPTYFTENQGNINPHDRLAYDESAKMIIRHVTDGIEMAEKAKLPQAIIDFIRTHHGLGRVKYFYTMYKNEHPNDMIDESVFRYPGPNPSTREQGILMFADSVEASSRSLKEFTEEKISAHINKIVDGIVDEGMLKNCPLTFRDVETIKQVFLDKLKTIYHSRITYPSLNVQETPKTDVTTDLNTDSPLNDLIIAPPVVKD